MPSLDDQITDLIGDLFSSGIARERLRVFAESVRAEALLEAASAEPFGDFVDASGWHAGYRAGVTSKTNAIRALIDAPPSVPPADVTRALAKLFSDWWRNEQECFKHFQTAHIGIGDMFKAGLIGPEGLVRAKLTDLGRAALLIAEGGDG